MKNRILIIVICMIVFLSGIMAGAKSVHASSFITANNPDLEDRSKIRKGPGTSYASDGIIYKNDIVYVSSIKNGWAKFKLRGEWRYVKASHLEKVK